MPVFAAVRALLRPDLIDDPPAPRRRTRGPTGAPLTSSASRRARTAEPQN